MGPLIEVISKHYGKLWREGTLSRGFNVTDFMQEPRHAYKQIYVYECTCSTYSMYLNMCAVTFMYICIQYRKLSIRI
jgi:hypothetical protein